MKITLKLDENEGPLMMLGTTSLLVSLVMVDISIICNLEPESLK